MIMAVIGFSLFYLPLSWVDIPEAGNASFWWCRGEPAFQGTARPLTKAGGTP
jgi:hypothetical protein